MARMKGLLAILLIFYVCAICGCSAGSQPIELRNSRAATADSPATPRAVAVEVFEVKPSAASDELLIPAATSVEGTAVVLARRDGTITQLLVNEGARVAKGEVMAQFNDEDQRTQLRQAELEVKRSKVEEQQYEALIKLNRNELERETLLARDGFSRKSDVESAQYKLEQALHEYAKTRLATQNAQERVEAAKIEIAKSTVRAPITGIITRRYISLGTSVARNDKLFEVSQLAPLQVKFQLPQTEKGWLGRGQTVNLSLVDSKGIVARARIRRIDPVADAASNTLGYLADVTGGAGLIPGLTVNVHVPRTATRGVLWVPRAAFTTGEELRGGVARTVLIVEDGKCVERIVEVNAVDGDQVEISSGLNLGERVILAPPAGLKAGDAVMVKQG